MIELRTLGALQLRGPSDRDCRAVLAQPKRLALLAHLALAYRGGFARRDAIVALFWPELDAEHARSALRQTLSFLRRGLGEEVILNGGDGVGVNEAALACDAVAFDRACDAGDLATALELYQGDLLDGVYVADAAPQLDHWIEDERTRLRERARRAAWDLANRCEASGQLEVAANHARRALALSPQDEGGLRRLMTLLDRLGDYDGCVRAYQTFERRLEAEYEVQPGAETVALMMRVRSRIGQPATHEGNGRAALAEPEPPKHQPALPGKPEASPQSSPARVEATNSSRLTAWVGAVLSAAASLFLIAWLRNTSAEPAAPVSGDSSRIVVLPFRVTSNDSSLGYLRDGMIDLLATKLTGEGGLRAIDPRTTVSASRRVLSTGHGTPTSDAFRIARAVAADQVLLGEIVQTSPRRLQLSGSVLSVSDGRLRARASVEGQADSLPALVDQLAARLLAVYAGDRDVRLAVVATRVPLPALRAFLDGRAAQRRGEDKAAVAHFGRAVRLDSTFALAAMEQASSMGWLFRWTVRQDSLIAPGVRLGTGLRMTGDHGLWTRAIDVAWRERARLNERDVAYLGALRGKRYPRASTAREVLSDWESVVRVAPDRADAWNRLGFALLQQGLALGLTESHRRATALFQQALSLDSGYVSPIAGLIEIAAYERDTARVQRLGRLYLARDSSSEHADYVRWRVASTLGDRTALAALRRRLDSFDSQTLDRIQWASQTAGIELEDAERASATLVRRAGERTERWVSLWLATILALNGGRPQEALRLGESKLQVEPDSGLFQSYRVVHALYWGGDSAAGADAARRLDHRARSVIAAGRSIGDPRDPYRELAIAEQWRLWHGDTTSAVATIALLRRGAELGGGPRRAIWGDLVDAIRAGVLGLPEAPALLERIDAMTLQGCCDTPHFLPIVVARLRERAGDRPAALRTIRRGRWYYPPEYLSTFLREEGRLAALTGDHEGAIRAYRHYLALRSNAEPAVRSEVEHIRAEVARLERGR
jgi:DNA-binding SARP family transcriptional activator/TolB-like protein